MPKELLSESYYITSEGKKDMFYELSYNCIVLSAYMLAKIKNMDAERLSTDTIQDLTFRVDVDAQDQIQYLFFNQLENAPSYMNIKAYEEKDGDAIPILLDVLDHGNPMVISTIHELMKCNCSYDPDFDVSKIDRNAGRHSFVILHYDEEYYYFLDDPFGQINADKFDSVNGKQEVGRYPRREMDEIFQRYLRCFHIEFDWNQENIVKDRCKMAIEVSKNQYELAPVEKTNHVVSTVGRSAIDKLRQLAIHKGIEYESIVPNTLISFIRTLDWNSTVMYKKRRVLQMYLEQLEKEGQIEYMPPQLLEVLKTCGDNWVDFRNMIVKDSIRQKEYFDSRYNEPLQKILKDEDSLMEQLEQVKIL